MPKVTKKSGCPAWWNPSLMFNADKETLNTVHEHYKVKAAPEPKTKKEEKDEEKQKKINKEADKAIKENVQAMDNATSVRQVEEAMQEIEQEAEKKVSKAGKPGKPSAAHRAAYHEARHRCTLSRVATVWGSEPGFSQRFPELESKHPELDALWEMIKHPGGRKSPEAPEPGSPQEEETMGEEQDASEEEGLEDIPEEGEDA